MSGFMSPLLRDNRTSDRPLSLQHFTHIILIIISLLDLNLSVNWNDFLYYFCSCYFPPTARVSPWADRRLWNKSPELSNVSSSLSSSFLHRLNGRSEKLTFDPEQPAYTHPGSAKWSIHLFCGSFLMSCVSSVQHCWCIFACSAVSVPVFLS